MNKSEYAQYLASREWAVLKVAVKKRANGMCERCAIAPIEATHHLTYERIGHESLDDLQGVCGDCHSFLSGLNSHDPRDDTRRMFVEMYSYVTRIIADLGELYSRADQIAFMKSPAEKIMAAYEFLFDLQQSLKPASADVPDTGPPHVPDDRHEAVG